MSGIKYESSPVESLAESFVSTPGTQYPPLFEEADAMTPQSFDDDSMFGSMAGTPAPETKKPVKKRKSWGQQLPEPKTNLPPRKRAKTEDEKEQRRVERVLRNRRAAQSSRERKRQEVEALEAKMFEKERVNQDVERRNRDLEMQLADMQAKYIAVQQQLELATGGKIDMVFRGSVASSPAHAEQYRAGSPVTFSQELFSSRDAPERSSFSSQHSVDAHSPFQTVNPASLSPEMRPVVEASNASSSDMTQQPAVLLWTPDLQCQSEEHRPWTKASTKTSVAISQLLFLMTLMPILSAVSSKLLTPMAQIINSLKSGSSLSPTTSILTLIIWLTTTPASISLTNSSTTKKVASQGPPRFSLRMSLLNRLLACSPMCARPLMDATMVVLRLASEQQLTRDCLAGTLPQDSLLSGTNVPSIEALMTLLWATHMFEKEWMQKESAKKEGQERELDVILTERKLSCVDEGQKSLEGWRRMA